MERVIHDKDWPVDLLRDYINEGLKIVVWLGGEGLGTVTLSQLREAQRTNPLKTVEKRYLSADLDQRCPEITAEIQQYPEIVVQLNLIATLANNTPDVQTCKRAFNAISRVLYGKDVDLRYKDPESNSDLLQV